MKKKIIRIISMLAIIAAVVSIVIIAKNRHENSIYEEARQRFEKEVLPEYSRELRNVGFYDLKLTVDYVEYPWEEWTEQVEVTEYYTEKIDSLYTEEYGSENANEIVRLLKSMRNIRNRYCKRYVYEIRGKEVTIFFNDSYSEFFTVHSEDYMYKIYTYNGKTSMSINGNPLYYSGGGSSSSVTNNNTTSNNHQHSAPSSTGKNDPYDVYDYNDPEDFYYDWEEDFDGYEDAEEYWEDAWDEVE